VKLAAQELVIHAAREYVFAMFVEAERFVRWMAVDAMAVDDRACSQWVEPRISPRR
jgi:hypothetical protein